MPRNDGIDRTIARNVNLTASLIANTQLHNEREKESYDDYTSVAYWYQTLPSAPLKPLPDDRDMIMK